MLFLNRKPILALCFAGILLQGSPLQAWSLRGWARKNEGISRTVLNGFSFAAFAGLQYAAFKHIPNLDENFKKYPGRIVPVAFALAGLVGLSLIKAIDAFLRPKDPKVTCNYFTFSINGQIFYACYLPPCLGDGGIMAPTKEDLEVRVQKCCPGFRINWQKGEYPYNDTSESEQYESQDEFKATVNELSDSDTQQHIFDPV